jgi:Bacterial Ig-like domain (group 2)
MRSVLAGLLVVLTVGPAGCGESPTPSAPSTIATTELVAVHIAPPPGDAGVVGVAVPLSATVLVDGVPLADASQGVGWSSSNTAVARVDARGVLTGVAPGQTVITASVKNTTGTLAVEVVPALSGSITITWIATDCTQHNAGCAARPCCTLRS